MHLTPAHKLNVALWAFFLFFTQQLLSAPLPIPYHPSCSELLSAMTRLQASNILDSRELLPYKGDALLLADQIDPEHPWMVWLDSKAHRQLMRYRYQNLFYLALDEALKQKGKNTSTLALFEKIEAHNIHLIYGALVRKLIVKENVIDRNLAVLLVSYFKSLTLENKQDFILGFTEYAHLTGAGSTKDVLLIQDYLKIPHEQFVSTFDFVHGQGDGRLRGAPPMHNLLVYLLLKND